jgi:uncharacterized membrane protein
MSNQAAEVILSVVTTGGDVAKSEVNIADYHRAPALGWLLIVFLLAFVIFGGKKGVKSLFALLISVCLDCICALAPQSQWL